MKFKWKRCGVGYKAYSDEYGAMIYANYGKYAIHAWRDFGDGRHASLDTGMWSDNGNVEEYMLPTIKAAKQKAEEFAKQLSKLEM